MTTLTFILYLTRVATSPISIVNPPSPTTQTTCRSGYAAAAPMLYGSPFAIVASDPERENCMVSRISMYRADQVAMVPLSEETMASLLRSLFKV